MEFPLSPISADLILQDLEIFELKKPFSLEFYRYVDDIILSTQEYNIDTIISNFSFHSRLKFITELGGNSLNFFNVTLIKKDNILLYD